MSILAFLKNAQTLLFLIIAGGFLTCNFSCGQIVTVNMQPSISNPATASATLTCNFMVDDPTYAFFNLEWRIGSTLLADFFGGAENPDYKTYCSSSGLCAITRNNSQSNFVLSSVEMAQNQGTYRCQVTFDKGFHSVDRQDTAYLTIVVPTANITLSNASSSEAFNEGAEVELSNDVANYIFKCEVPGINPQAIFTWTVGGQLLPSESINENRVVGADGLTRSISNATLAPKWTYDNQTLMCKAVNYNGDPGVTISVTLKTTDPCTGVVCMNGGTCIPNAVTNDPKCHCTVDYTGDLCETVCKSNSTRKKRCASGETCYEREACAEARPTKKTKLSDGEIVGIIVGCAGGVLVTIGIVIFVIRKKRRENKEHPTHAPIDSETPMTRTSNSNANATTEELQKDLR